MTDYVEYTIRVRDDDGPKSVHDKLARLAKQSRRARRYNGDEVEADTDDGDSELSDYLAYVIKQESGERSAR